MFRFCSNIFANSLLELIKLTHSINTQSNCELTLTSVSAQFNQCYPQQAGKKTTIALHDFILKMSDWPCLAKCRRQCHCVFDVILLLMLASTLVASSRVRCHLVVCLDHLYFRTIMWQGFIRWRKLLPQDSSLRRDCWDWCDVMALHLGRWGHSLLPRFCRSTQGSVIMSLRLLV